MIAFVTHSFPFLIASHQPCLAYFSKPTKIKKNVHISKLYDDPY